MPTRQGLSPAKKACTWPRRSRFLSTTLPSAAIAVDLEDVLGEIEADGCNLHDGWLPLVTFDSHLGTPMP